MLIVTNDETATQKRQDHVMITRFMIIPNQIFRHQCKNTLNDTKDNTSLPKSQNPMIVVSEKCHIAEAEN